MSVGLLAVVDDILTAAMRASAKTAGVVIDDAAVAPQYVQGLTPARELPVIFKIGVGSMANKFVVVIPVALLLSAFAPWALPWLLVFGGTYLCYEGAEKVLEWFGVHHAHAESGPRDERRLVVGAIRTDLILSAEIMLIALSNIEDTSNTWRTLAILSVIAVVITVGVYGAVALLVKIDDIGMRLAESDPTRSLGRVIVRSMPAVFRVISIVGTVAMLWVGGHLLLQNLAEVGWHWPMDALHAAAGMVRAAGPTAMWVVDTIIAAVVGLAAGLTVVAVVGAVRRASGRRRA